MTKLLLVYVTCPSRAEALRIGREMLGKRLCACINCVDGMHSAYFWPPKSGEIEEADETILILKTTPVLYEKLAAEVGKVHPSTCPCTIGIPVEEVNAPYLEWIKSELAEGSA